MNAGTPGRAVFLALLAISLAFGSAVPSGARPAKLPCTSPEWRTKHVDPLAYFTEDELTTWRSFRNRQRALSLSALLLSLLLYGAFVFTSAGKRTYGLAERLTTSTGALAPFRSRTARGLSSILHRVFGPDWASALVFTWLFMLIVALFFLPLQMLAEQDARAAGLSVYTNPAWLWDLFKGRLLRAISLTFVVFGLFGLIRRLPRFWWLALGAPAALFMVVWGLLSPYQSRVFYEVSPLDDEALVSRFERLPERRGVELTAVKVIDASRHTRAINAYVAGLGPSREMVLFDTTLELLDEEELEAVLAHELGHIEMDWPVLRYSLSALALVLLLWMLSRVLRFVPSRLGLDGQHDPRALPLLLLFVSVCFLVARPLELAWSRHEERLADRSALVLTGDPDAFIRLQIALARHNLADVDPPPWVRFWFATHPSTIDRIGTALWYESWLLEQRESSERARSEEDGRLMFSR